MRLMIIAQSITVGTVQGGQPIISLNYRQPTAQVLVLDLLPAARPEDFVLTTELTAHTADANLRVFGVVRSSRRLRLSTPMVMMRQAAPSSPGSVTFEYLIAGRMPVSHQLLNLLYQYIRQQGSILLRCGVHDAPYPGKTVTFNNWELGLRSILTQKEFHAYFRDRFAA